MFVGCFRYGYNIRAIMHLPVFASEGFVPIYVVAGLPDELTFRFVRNSVEASPVIVTVMSYGFVSSSSEYVIMYLLTADTSPVFLSQYLSQITSFPS